MTLRAAISLCFFLVLFAFVGLNWTEFVTPTTLSTGFGFVQAPIGLIMLGILILVVGIFVVYILYLHASELLRMRRQLKEMEVQKKLVDQAEASRITDLRNFIDDQFMEQRRLHDASVAAITAKLDASQLTCKGWIEESGNTLSAHLGEIEDRLDRLLPQSNSPKP